VGPPTPGRAGRGRAVISDNRRTVHLDTSFLIRALVAGSPEFRKLRGWLGNRTPVAMSAFAWGEFLCGPLDDAARARARRVAYRHVPLGTEEAELAARLFNLGGRRWGSFPDCVIAATAMVSEAGLATSNTDDFDRLVEAGLELMD